jgi:hypothetical protein
MVSRAAQALEATQARVAGRRRLRSRARRDRGCSPAILTTSNMRPDARTVPVVSAPQVLADPRSPVRSGSQHWDGWTVDPPMRDHGCPGVLHRSGGHRWARLVNRGSGSMCFRALVAQGIEHRFPNYRCWIDYTLATCSSAERRSDSWCPHARSVLGGSVVRIAGCRPVPYGNTAFSEVRRRSIRLYCGCPGDQLSRRDGGQESDP